MKPKSKEMENKIIIIIITESEVVMGRSQTEALPY